MAFETFRQLMRGIQGKFSITEGQILQNSQQAAFMRQIQKDLKKENALFTPLDELNVVVFDIETTGFYPEHGDEILSIGAVRIRGGEIRMEEVFYSLVYYEGALSIDIETLTGLKREELSEARPLADVLVEFFDFVQNAPLVAHHAQHEKSFLQNATWKLFKTPFKHRIIDTSFLYRIADPDLSLAKLEELCVYNGIMVQNRHHALGDAILAAKIWCMYVKKVKVTCKNLNEVYEHLAK